ncbi:hypothetical protein L1987_21589 [Smallanthus sonchifolius]|uniref:Uncharacterized protein n=1 Tax=Smallanthus sonchifolius TaxID=185202 RepID=A0ACB9IXX0_9ASTR|nr:hypothetical protein L1987_21589 [Smallanthus sonchifolius]
MCGGSMASGSVNLKILQTLKPKNFLPYQDRQTSPYSVQKLDMLAASHPNLKVFYTVDSPSKYWVGSTGYIS